MGLAAQIESTILGRTQFRNDLKKILDELDGPKVIVNNSIPDVVVIPFDQYKAMEETIEMYNDLLLSRMADERLNDDSTTVSHDEMWDRLLGDNDES